MGAWFKNPFTDITGNLFTLQTEKEHPLCRTIEMQLYKCVEAHGVPRWQRECKDEYDDFMECISFRKQKERFVCMYNERQRQWQNGESTREFMPNPGKYDWQPPTR